MEDSFIRYRSIKPRRTVIGSSEDEEDEDFLEMSETEQISINKSNISKPARYSPTSSDSTNFDPNSSEDGVVKNASFSSENDVVNGASFQTDQSFLDSSITYPVSTSSHKLGDGIVIEESEEESEGLESEEGGEELESEEEREEFEYKKREILKYKEEIEELISEEREKLEFKEEREELEKERESEELVSEEEIQELEKERESEELVSEEEIQELEKERESEELVSEEEIQELVSEEERKEAKPKGERESHTHSYQNDSVDLFDSESDREKGIPSELSKDRTAFVELDEDSVLIDEESEEEASSHRTPVFPKVLKEKTSQNVSPGIENSPPYGTIPKAAAWSTLPTTESNVQNFGKRAMKTHLTQQSLTIETLTTLHSALKACPSEDTFSEDPQGLKVELMPHQKHALAWLIWREGERPSGGILADDMGLGKTLTMIALVMKSRENEEKENAEDSDSDVEDDGWTESKRRKMPRGGTLVVCPASLVGQWEGEINRRCNKGLLSVLLYHGNYRETRVRRIARKDVVITTYNLMSRESGVETSKNCTVMKSPGPLHSIKWKRIILDEAHIVRNHKSQTAMGVFELSGKHRWCLTGTPIQNKELDLFALMKFLRCSPFDDLSVWKRWVDNKNAAGMQRLSTMMKSLMLRRTKEQLQEKGGLKSLPTKDFEIIPVKLDAEEMKIYKKVALFSSTLFMQFLGQRAEKFQHQEARYGQSNLPVWEQGDRPDNQFFTDKKIVDMYRRMKMKNTEVKSHQILVLLLRLRQICCHPGLIREMLEKEDLTGADVEDENGGQDLDDDLFSAMEKLTIDGDETDERAEESADTSFENILDFGRPSSKIRAVLDVVLEKVLQSEDKAVIVSQWTSVLNIVHDHLRDMGVKCEMLSGSVPVPKRMEMVDNFNSARNKVKVLLLSLTAGGVGLNLVGGNHLLLIDVHWNPQLEAQACDRVYRVGQTKPVHIYKFVCSDTVEERIKRLQEIKLSLAQNVLTGTTSSQASKLSLQDLKMLFGLNMPPPRPDF